MSLYRPGPEIWPLILPLVIRGVAEGGGTFGPEDYRKGLDEGTMQLWATGDPPKAICITELLDTPKKRLCQILLLAGDDMAEWLVERGQIEAWAKEYGCVAMTIPHGRKGWERALPDYRVAAIYLEKEL